MNKKFVLIIIVIVAALGLAIGTVYFIFFREKPSEEKKGVPANFNAGTEIKVGVDLGNIGEATENPLKDMPSVNPMEEVANPYRDSYKNPFK